MKKIILVSIFLFSVSFLFSQITFLGFEEEQCGLITDYGFTYENIDKMCGSHSYGYRVFRYGEMVYQDCIPYGGCSVHKMFFLSQNTGFIIEHNTLYGKKVLKTSDAGETWPWIGGGGPVYLGFYIVNTHTTYLITYINPPNENIVIYRASDIREQHYEVPLTNTHTIIQDTIFGDPICPMDALHFKIIYGTDTLNYTIEFAQMIPVGIKDEVVQNRFTLAPNPAQDFVNIQSGVTQNGIQSVKIFNQFGALVKVVERYEDTPLFIDDLKSGIYFVEINTREKKETVKLIKF
ncbi:MAG: T9SS type A sorting domain-containing protein [Bacteroidales bacterium]|nr:T9SS type A sorting domain-containing protein [Bacteroidales bacterium]